jgi:tetratricopeptide (TPR) repeat protein
MPGFFIAGFLALSLCSAAAAARNDDYRGWEEVGYLRALLRMAVNPPKEDHATEEIYSEGEALFCTGNTRAAAENNRAARLIRDGKYDEAMKILKEALPNASLFFPFRYNMGICHLHRNELTLAHLSFTKAQQVVPEYSGTYLQMGYIYQRWNRDSEAVESYREALRRNSGEIGTFVLIGDVFFNRNQLEMARKYYEASLRLKPMFPDGLLGQAKLHFINKKYLNALNLLKAIDTSGRYDKALHFYYAECAFRLKDYETAYRQYEELLKHASDRFFLTNSPALIRHKLYLSKQFVAP